MFEVLGGRAIAGRRDMMTVFDASSGRPLLPQGGTFSANPLSMVAGLASMTALDQAAFDHLEALGARLRDHLGGAIARHRAPFSVSGAASLFRIHPKANLPRDFREATPSAADVSSAVATDVTRSVNSCASSTTSSECSGSTADSATASMASSA